MNVEAIYILAVIATGYCHLVEQQKVASNIALQDDLHGKSENGSATRNNKDDQSRKFTLKSTATLSGNRTSLDKKDESITNQKNKNGTEVKNAGPFISIKLLHGEDSAISMSGTSTRKRLPEVFKGSHLNVYSIDYQYNDRLVFFIAQNKLYRATLTGRSTISTPEVIVDSEVDGPVRLAVDWVHRQLYWMADKYQTIMTADFNGTNQRLLFDDIDKFGFPNNINVDPYMGLLFFVSNYAVYKSTLDGKNVTMVPIEGNTPGQEGRGVRCLAVDRVNHRLYFSGQNHGGSENTHYLARADYDGSEVEDYNTTALGDVYSLEVLGDTLYFARRQHTACRHEVLSASAESLSEFNPRKIFVPRRCKSDMWGIKIFHPCVQRPSSDGYCSALYG